MKVALMFQDRDYELPRKLPPNADALIQDLELQTLFKAMTRGDRFLDEVLPQMFLTSLHDPDAIRYRQEILKDCLKNPVVVREIYNIALESIEYKRREWLGIFSSYPSGILSNAVRMLQVFIQLLRKLRAIADEHASKFDSPGFQAFFARIKTDLDEAFFADVQQHLKTLRFRDGVLVSARLGPGNEGASYVLREPINGRQPRLMQILSPKLRGHTFCINPRDEHGARFLGELRDRGINLVANAVAQSANHVDGFLKALQLELALYIGCLNLQERLSELGQPICIPEVAALTARRHCFTELYDVCLALTMGKSVVGNTADMDRKALVIVTGANQGGKSTFLRSIGLAQMMLQCGMFAPAETFAANLCAGVFTHYKREEDATMESGKLDEELGRMSKIVDSITPHALVLFNESFAATNEREGSEIAWQITRALVEGHIKVFFVTHLYQFAQSFQVPGRDDVGFLRAERQPDGRRTFRLVEGQPLETSFGEDLYRQVFEPTPSVEGQAVAQVER